MTRRRFHAGELGRPSRRQPARAGPAEPGLRGAGGARPDRQPARRQARRAQSRFLQLHDLEDRPRRPHRADRPRLRAAHPGLRHRADGDAGLRPAEPGEFRSRCMASTRSAAASRSPRSSPPCASSSPRRPDRADDHPRRRPALPLARPRRSIPGAPMTDNIARLDGLVPDRLRPKTRKIVLEDYALNLDIGFHDFEVGNSAAAAGHGRGLGRRGRLRRRRRSGGRLGL